MGTKYLVRIDGIRAVAVVLVLLFHLEFGRFSGGYIGVDIFFVISGFLLTRNISLNLVNGTFSFSSFYLARIRRIFPALFFLLFVCLIFGSVFTSPVALYELSRETLAAALSASNILFWLDAGYFDADSSTKPLLHTWSLGVEEQYYLVLPLVLYYVAKKFGSRQIGTLLVAFFIVGLGLSELSAIRYPAASFFLFPSRIFQFALGGILGYAYSRDLSILKLAERRVVSECSAVLAIAVIALTTSKYDELTRFAGLNALWPSTAAFLLIFASNSTISKVLLENSVASFLGKISYSLYLTHWPIIVFTKYLNNWQGIPFSAKIMIGISSVATGYLMYRFVEQPFREHEVGDRTYSIGDRKLLKWVAAIVLPVTVLSFYSMLSVGAPWRLETWGQVPASRVNFGDLQSFHTEYYGGAGCNPIRCETEPAAAGPRSLVLGDSHARALFKGLQINYPDRDFVIFGPNSCSIYSLQYLFSQTKYDEYCAESQRLAIDEMEQQTFESVVIHAHWWARLKAKQYNEDGSVELRFESLDEQIEFLVQEIDDFVDKNGLSNVYVIGGIPRYHLSSSPADCLGRPFKSATCERASRDAVKLRDQDEINKAMKDAFEAAGSSVNFIDPYDELCDRYTCDIYTPDGYPVYSDPTHLSIWGSDYFVKLIRDQLASN